MAEFLTNFHFLRPYWLLLFVFPIVFYWKFLKGSKNKSSWENVVDKKLLDFLLIRGSAKVRNFAYILAFAGFVGAISALAGPTWKSSEKHTFQPDNPVMILLNVSSDMYETDITPNRITRAKFKISDLFAEIKKAQAGMIIYTDEPYLITPITDDLRVIKNLLPVIDLDIMPSNGDRLDRAIALAADRLRDAGFVFGNIVVVAPDVGQEFNKALVEAKRANEMGYNVSVIAVNSANVEKLEMVARYGGGIYLNLTAGDADIMKIAEEINNSIGEELKATENFSSQWEDFGYYLLIIPLLCCLYFFRKGILAAVFVMMLNSNANAGFFLNDNQEGLRSFMDGEFAKAAEKFKNEKWKAAAYYRLGDYEKSLKEFGKFDDVTSIYNQGNALAKGGKIEEAIAKYEKVLEIEPSHEDAKFNLEYLKQQQEQQQQKQSSDSNNDDEQNEENKDSDSSSEQGQSGEDEKGEQDQQSSQGEGENDTNQPEQDKEQNQQPSSQDNEQEGDEEKQQSQQQQNKDRPTEEQKGEKPSSPKGLEDADDDKFDEEMLAREMLYREVPEDPGGLMRAFIRKEHMMRRYKE